MASSIIKKLIISPSGATRNTSSNPSATEVDALRNRENEEASREQARANQHPWDSGDNVEKSTTISSKQSLPSPSQSQPASVTFAATLKGLQNPFPNYFKSSSKTSNTPSSPSIPSQVTPALSPTKNVIVPWLDDDDSSQSDTPTDSSSLLENHPISSPSKSAYSRAWSYLSSLSSWLFKGNEKVLQDHDNSKTNDIRLKPVQEIEKIVIIGVHGWFPNKMLQRVVGEPIGTSAHFAAKMEAAVLKYFGDRKRDLQSLNIKVVPLEGGGKIFDRVLILYHQLLEKAMQDIKSADLVIFSAHSQGSPVSALILQKLIREGILNPSLQRVAILAMAGISHGPFPLLKNSVIIQYVETEQAKELFDFNDPAKQVSESYMNAMKDILECGCRYVAIGSWYDQVVPLYSATIQGINHPNLYRALYIDEKDYQPDFLSHLLAFALKLRNNGLTDHGLCVHLSDALAGSIYGFGTQGHSAVYEEDLTYTLGVKWALLSSPTPAAPQTPILGHLHAPSKINPFYLPWIWAHLSMDPAIQQNLELKRDLEMLKLLFLRWNPSASHLKDIKYRLEPIKSKL